MLFLNKFIWCYRNYCDYPASIAMFFIIIYIIYINLQFST